MNLLKVVGIVIMLTSLVGCASVGVVAPNTKSSGFNSLETKADVLAQNYKEPTILKEEDGHEVWKYRKKNLWCGVVFIIVPVMLPVCSNYVAYTFDRDAVVRTEWRETEFHGFTCFFIPPFVPPLGGVECF